MSIWVILHPEAARDLKDMAVRSIWADSYREFRKARPRENLTPGQILAKFSQDLFLAGHAERLWGIRF